jgi:hypothetical protein
MHQAILTVAKKYSVEEAVARILERKLGRGKRRSYMILTNALEIGRLLLEIKELLPHGGLGPLVRQEFWFSARAGQLWMNAVPLADKNPDLIAEFQPAALYLLAAPGTPDAVRNRVLTAMREGQPCPSAKLLKNEIDEAKVEAKAAEAAVEVGVTPTVTDDFVDFNFDIDCDNYVSLKAAESRNRVSQLASLLITNLAREQLGQTARLLRSVDLLDLQRVVSRVQFKSLESMQLNSSELEIRLRVSDGALG